MSLKRSFSRELVERRIAPLRADGKQASSTLSLATVKQNPEKEKILAEREKDRKKWARNMCLMVTMVRHGDTDLTAQKPRVLQGQSDTPLNIKGKKQAVVTGWRLRKNKFNYVYTSDLQSCKQTTDEILKYQPDLKARYDQRLREQHMGQFTGQQWPDIKSQLRNTPGPASTRTFQENLPEFGGESEETFEERVLEFYTDIIDKHLVIPHEELLKKANLADKVADLKEKEKEKEKEKAKNNNGDISSLHRTALLKNGLENGLKKSEMNSSSPNLSSSDTMNALKKLGENLDEQVSAKQSGENKENTNTDLHNTKHAAEEPVTSVTPKPNLIKTSSSVPEGLDKIGPKAISTFDLDAPCDPVVENIASHLGMMKGTHGKKHKLKGNSVLVVTSGGVIQRLMQHFIEELNFTIETPEPEPGFPKTASVYRFIIHKVFKEDDYEWEGKVCLMNDVSHLASLGKKYNASLGRNPTTAAIIPQPAPLKTAKTASTSSLTGSTARRTLWGLMTSSSSSSSKSLTGSPASSPKVSKKPSLLKSTLGKSKDGESPKPATPKKSSRSLGW